MKVVVGLGNPGRRYHNTRHNVGFDLLSDLADLSLEPASWRERFDSEVADIFIGDTRLLLVAPQTFMNLSGKAVAQVARFFQTENDDILVVCDDFQLPLGRLRMRRTGSAGGQKGLQNIIDRLGSPDVPRLRIGIGPVPGRMAAQDFVLGRFNEQQRSDIDSVLLVARDAVVRWARNGPDSAMNDVNGWRLDDDSS